MDDKQNSRVVYMHKIEQDSFYINTWEHSSMETHKHDFLELTYILDGTAEHVVDGKKYTITKGDYFVVDYGSSHSYKTKYFETIKLVNCLFFPEFIDKTMRDCRTLNDVLNNYLIKFNKAVFSKMPTETVFHDDDGKIGKLILKMLDEFGTKKIGYREVLRCLLIETIILIMRSACIDEKKDSADTVIEKIISYVDKNFARPISLSNICSELKYSLPYISKYFKESMNMTFSCYLQKVRMENACRLLAYTDKKVEDIAEDVGYNDIKFFNKVFKRILNTTPREYRSKF